MSAENTGIESVQMTPRVLEESYLPALQEVLNNTYQGKVAHAVVKNYRYALRMKRAVEKKRYELLEKYAERDEKGGIATEQNEQGQVMAKLGGNKENFDKEISKYYMEHLHDIKVHRVNEEDIMGMNNIRPAAMLMLAPMFNPDPEERDEEEGGGSLTPPEPVAPMAIVPKETTDKLKEELDDPEIPDATVDPTTQAPDEVGYQVNEPEPAISENDDFQP